MNKDYLSQSEDNYFTSLVIKYNETKNEKEKEELRPIIEERLKKLIYLICKQRLYLNDELTSAVYVKVYDEIDRIISSYKIATFSFNSYLRNVCIFRIRRIYKEREMKTMLEGEYLYEETPYYLDECPLEKYQRNFLKPVIYDVLKIRSMSLKELASYIITTKSDVISPSRTPAEKVLKEKLKNEYFRRNFIFFILSIPLESVRNEAENYARIFNTEEEAFIRLIELKSKYLGQYEEAKKKDLEIIAKHWRLMAKMKRSMSLTADRKEYCVLKENYTAQAKCHKKKIEKYFSSQRGMHHALIASNFDVCRTTVSMGISIVRKELEKISSLNSE